MADVECSDGMINQRFFLGKETHIDYRTFYMTHKIGIVRGVYVVLK